MITQVYYGPIVPFGTPIELWRHLIKSGLGNHVRGVWPGPHGEAVGGFNYHDKTYSIKCTTQGIKGGDISVELFNAEEAESERVSKIIKDISRVTSVPEAHRYLRLGARRAGIIFTENAWDKYMSAIFDNADNPEQENLRTFREGIGSDLSTILAHPYFEKLETEVTREYKKAKLEINEPSEDFDMPLFNAEIQLLASAAITSSGSFKDLKDNINLSGLYVIHTPVDIALWNMYEQLTKSYAQRRETISPTDIRSNEVHKIHVFFSQPDIVDMISKEVPRAVELLHPLDRAMYDQRKATDDRPTYDLVFRYVEQRMKHKFTEQYVK
ncbi:MAG: hypothetical protein WC254_03395 [Candidatus Woesearchaeota archaeon]|jgi:hypothetical protein